MGGGHHFHYPKWVWSPSGGWWPNPSAWKRNTAIYAGFMVLASAYIYTHSTPKTVAYYPGRKTEDAHPIGGHH